MREQDKGWIGLIVLCVAGVAWNNATMWDWILDQIVWVAGSMLGVAWLFALGGFSEPYHVRKFKAEYEAKRQAERDAEQVEDDKSL